MHLTEWKPVHALQWKERKKQTKYANNEKSVKGAVTGGKTKNGRLKEKKEKDDRQVEEVRQSLSEGW